MFPFVILCSIDNTIEEWGVSLTQIRIKVSVRFEINFLI